MKKTLIRGMVAGFLAVGLCVAAGAQTQTPKKSKIPAALQKDAKISVEAARATALKKVPGEILEEELEKEHGKLIWSFDIAQVGSKNITEIQVDAKTGKIVSTQIETPAKQRKEAIADKEEGKGY